MHVTSSYMHMIMYDINTSLSGRKYQRHHLSIKEKSKSIIINHIQTIFPAEVYIKKS